MPTKVGYRVPSVAGSFYPADREGLNRALAELFQDPPLSYPEIAPQALVSPHAGYVYSGKVAASVFQQLDPSKPYRRVFLLGTSHNSSFDGVSLYSSGPFLTPLGEARVDAGAMETLYSQNAVFRHPESVHIKEHSLEVQVPFLQHVYGKKLSLVPMLLGTSSAKTCHKIALELLPWFTPENLFVISSDLSHYPSYSDAIGVDRQTVRGILSNSPGTFLKTIQQLEKFPVEGLSTAVCGWTALLTLLYMTSTEGNWSFRQEMYANSGDSPMGDKYRVVGYSGITVRPESGKDTIDTVFLLNTCDKMIMLQIARESLDSFFDGREPRMPKNVPPILHESAGVFVSLYYKKNLRGCIGRMPDGEALYTGVSEMTLSAALHDSRFEPVTRAELGDLDIEVAVLTPTREIKDLDEIELGRHGVMVRKGNKKGIFLPKVAPSMGWTAEELVSRCAQEKAGMGPGEWREAQIHVFEAVVFSEHEEMR